MPSIDYLNECRNFYARVLQPQFDVPLGISEAAVKELERELGFALPESYRQFLLWMGNDKQGALRGSEWFADEIVFNNEFLDEFLSDNGIAETTSDRRVCFFVHQGYMAAWFDCLDGSDPICRFYSEANSEPFAIDAGPFTSFLLKELQGVADAVKT
ncbi:SMI1/KNR4 family protein [Ruegeria sp. Ofav3-42]|uniref:SMI1/KNR4 family protein n=1 Tax=Ruegeria sp. Ofav3-42 TaxID=2917759 RepID=UPI001EF4C35F|nr:SMI1/KNR4 family protein [Ruegeria sp. Ofav3-42]MCG7521617.1 SMI1/KNR4 family protein [Ruegeria sp. Ofav3-42]